MRNEQKTARTYLIKPFDPWKSRLCTCPTKYSFDPYTGCCYRCAYCYVSSYVQDFFRCRPKKDLLRLVRRDLERLPRNALISMSNSSDPYPPMEGELGLTRACLKEFLKQDVRVLVITKGELVVRDVDLLLKLGAAVTMTITTLDDWLAKKLEPGAPSPSKRLDVLLKLYLEGVSVGLRLDPIIPGVNDGGFERLLREAKDAGVSHVVSSTFKPRYDSWKRVLSLFPGEGERLKKLYLEEGEVIGRSRYLSRKLRYRILKRVAGECEKLGLSFACCREGFSQLHTAPTCDGSHLIKKKFRAV